MGLLRSICLVNVRDRVGSIGSNIELHIIRKKSCIQKWVWLFLLVGDSIFGIKILFLNKIHTIYS